MADIRIQDGASRRLDEIYVYTREKWGARQAKDYIEGLFEAFSNIHDHGVLSKPIPAAFGHEGFYFRYQHHFVYWRYLSNGDIGIVTILHERMHQMDHFRDDTDKPHE